MVHFVISLFALSLGAGGLRFLIVSVHKNLFIVSFCCNSHADELSCRRTCMSMVFSAFGSYYLIPDKFDFFFNW